MPPRLVSEQQLLERLTDVFRTVGFEGASLTELAQATGLQKSSLYHRFPDGKSQMATEVLQHLADDVLVAALAPLESDGPIRARVQQVGRTLMAFYDGGVRSCLLDTMSLGEPAAATHDALAAAAGRWIDAFARVARSSGARPAAALVRAQDAIGAIEGGLVLARATNDTGAFVRAIERLPDVLLGPTTSNRTTSNRTTSNRTTKER
ncbi:MAG: Transcriptional regulator, TetR family [Ilumatobacteraceae bacterium]|nr:Transcriptional regulator, TetR family [Ilumatobacteraceae bacterium]